MIYLVFNEGYAASSGASVVRHDLASEAIRLGRLLVGLLPEPEAMGLLALMLLHESRRAARMTADGDLVLLDAQDRQRWDRAQIDEGLALVDRALASRRIGPYVLQAAIGAVHADAVCREHRLGRDRRTLRRVGQGRAVAGGAAQSCGRRGDARRPRGRSRPLMA